jgi:purine-binding chemotaxis protein CheW
MLDAPDRLLVFRLDGAEYALPIEQVAEIVRMVAITPVPGSPSWMAGAIDLRGSVIPVVDLRLRLGLPERAPQPSTPIMVGRTGSRVVGLIADEVVDVLDLAPDRIDALDEAAASGGLVKGIARLDMGLVAVLDLGRMADGSSDVLSAAHTDEP